MLKCKMSYNFYLQLFPYITEISPCHRVAGSFRPILKMTTLVYFLGLFFILAFASDCMCRDTSVCKYSKLASILDCSDQGFNQIPVPGAKYKKLKITVLDLRRNNVSFISEKEVLELYPGVVVVDIRDNPVKCGQLVLSRIQIKSNCREIQYIHPSSVEYSLHTTSCSKAMDLGYTVREQECRSCNKKNAFDSAQTVPNTVLISSNSSSSFADNNQTKIVLIATIIPILLLSFIIFGVCTHRCQQRTNVQDTGVIEMSQIGSSTTTVNTQHSTVSSSQSSIELYNASEV